jgi:hypothetical protein
MNHLRRLILFMSLGMVLCISMIIIIFTTSPQNFNILFGIDKEDITNTICEIKNITISNMKKIEKIQRNMWWWWITYVIMYYEKQILLNVNTNTNTNTNLNNKILEISCYSETKNDVLLCASKYKINMTIHCCIENKQLVEECIPFNLTGTILLFIHIILIFIMICVLPILNCIFCRDIPKKHTIPIPMNLRYDPNIDDIERKYNR